jgi:hypothetical protein
MLVQAHPKVERLSLAQNGHLLSPISAKIVGQVFAKFDWPLMEISLRDEKLQ